MDEAWKASFEKVLAEADVLKKEALNRHDSAFDPWHRRARSVLLQFAPVKIPAFDEIRFASDYFLSKPGEEQLDINDRIALACDLDLAIEIFRLSAAQVEEDLRFKKRRARIGGASLEAPAAAPQTSPAAQAPVPDFEALNALVAALDLTQREKEEAGEELRRARQALLADPPDWDRVKRTVKFLLDFDRTLALKAVPVLLRAFEQNNRG